MPVFRKLAGPILRNDAEGADTIVWLGAAPEPLRSPRASFWMDRRRASDALPIGAAPDGVEAREELWNLCERLGNAA